MVVGQEPWRVRISRDSGRICGAGVLFDRSRVLTCAHVVLDALGAEASETPPAGRVWLDFPSLAGVSRLAEVVSAGWVPRSPDGRGDVAVLQLDEPVPEELTPAVLAHCGELGDRAVRAYGHPAGVPAGVWALTKLVGYVGPGNEWVQMDGTTVTGRRVERGFSGAGAVDDRSGAVVGLVVAEDRQQANKVAWMIPMELVSRYLPSALPPVRPPSGAASAVTARSSRAAVPERRLSPAEHGDLCQELSAVPGMLDRPTRDLYIWNLERQLDEPLNFSRQSIDHLDVWELVSACLAQPGSIRTLLELLNEMHRGHPSIDALVDSVERLFPDLLLQHGERVELEGLLADVSRASLAAAFQHATAGLPGVPPPGGRPDAVTMIRHLEGYGRLRRGPPPSLLVFADDLAHQTGGRMSVSIHQWIDRVGDRLEVNRAALRHLCLAADQRRAEAAPVYFVVQLTPDSVDLDRFLMSAWLQHGSHTERLLLRDDLPRTLAEAAVVVADLLPTMLEQVAVDAHDLTVEFILPRRLIGHPVDQWEFDRHVFPRPLGIRYPVVVRSLDRLSNRLHHDMWRHKWHWLVENGHRRDPSAIACIGTSGSRDRRALYSELAADGPPVFLALPFTPADVAPSGDDELTAALVAGLPVIMWPQEPVNEAEFCAAVRDVLAAEGILDLPRRLLSLRLGAMRRMDPTRQPPLFPVRVGLLWDDADRIPPPFRRQVRLQAPR